MALPARETPGRKGRDPEPPHASFPTHLRYGGPTRRDARARSDVVGRLEADPRDLSQDAWPGGRQALPSTDLAGGQAGAGWLRREDQLEKPRQALGPVQLGPPSHSRMGAQEALTCDAKKSSCSADSSGVTSGGSLTVLRICVRSGSAVFAVLDIFFAPRFISRRLPSADSGRPA